jgi:hypothetical protein
MTEIKKTPSAIEKVSEPIIAENMSLVNPEDKGLDIDSYIQTRQEFITKVSAITVEGKDYHVIQGRKSLAKGGAEKIAAIFNWQAGFKQDAETLEMVGKPIGLVAFVCTLTKNGVFVGEGRGTADLKKNSSDANRTVKMAQKSAFIDAVLRSSGLSDFFTQDLEDMSFEEKDTSYEHGATSKPVKKTYAPDYATESKAFPPSQAQLTLIGKVMKEKGITKEDILDAGFVGDSRKLTGGKDGTASELIGWLFAHKGKIVNGQQVEELPTISIIDEVFNSQKEMEEIGDSIT